MAAAVLKICAKRSSRRKLFGLTVTQQIIVVRQKQMRKAREGKLAEEGWTPEYIKKLRKRKKFNQENHFDDCLSDLGPFEEIPLINALVVDGSLGLVYGL